MTKQEQTNELTEYMMNMQDDYPRETVEKIFSKIMEEKNERPN